MEVMSSLDWDCVWLVTEDESLIRFGFEASIAGLKNSIRFLEEPEAIFCFHQIGRE